MLQNSKKIGCFILLIFAFILPCSAVIEEVRSDSFTIQAGYGEVCEINIEAIPAQSQAYIAGMPFDIEDAIVTYSSSLEGGRTIARFNILSNTPFKISFEGNPMRYMPTDSAETYSTKYEDLHYILYFDCEIGIYRNGELLPTGSSTFSYSSRSTEDQSWSPNVSSMDENSYIGNVEGTIRFMFDELTSSFINSPLPGDTDLPPGTYGAEVYVYIEADDSQGGV